MRIGSGYDVHRLVAGRKLVLGGVAIDHGLGLLGHSDADVLVHSVCDALLGAAGLGDIGQHFPDSDPKFKDISSLVLLARCRELLAAKGFVVSNIDCTVLAERPRLAPHRSAMERTMAAALDLAPDRVNVKATTTEGLGFAGRGEGIGAHTVVLITEIAAQPRV
ncbi:2-C-methyl-D-erythritol 2,4-cyclodiphosphate synthase [Desulforapulum autotrophicum]|uniref:2-C-methyl-D-erythritol 2,4-cyclodiphosphate synthase n=1 Tax=Desulforapulum autotrophicum TaxID=2296 RepID=UPI0002D8F21D|nr:2-C-methyl-D-erythritol 2,4-cyclodiphosphate synthase [Desulforapulum autotrophicum]